LKLLGYIITRVKNRQANKLLNNKTNSKTYL
jgi:hypothetical protein